MPRPTGHHDKDLTKLKQRIDELEKGFGGLEQRLDRVDQRLANLEHHFEQLIDHVSAIKAALEGRNLTSVEYSLKAGSIVGSGAKAGKLKACG